MILEALRNHAQLNDLTVQKNLEGVSHEDSLGPGPGGANGLNWVLGHMLHARSGLLVLLGGEAQSDEAHARLYGRGSTALDPAEAVSFDELRQRWQASQGALLSRLDAVTDSELERAVPHLFDPSATQSAANQAGSFLFHESYHAGQLGILRRGLGKAGALA